MSNEQILNKKQQFITLLIIALIGTLLFILTSRKGEIEKKTNEERLSQDFFIMGTVFQCNFFSDDENENILARERVHEELKKVERCCNLFDSNSELYRLNKLAHVKPFVCSDELWGILQKCREAYILSDKSFDISAKPLMDLWGFYRKQENVPSEKEIADSLKFVGLEKVVFNDKEKSVFFPEKGFAFDLGGIAKGISVDYAINSIRDLNLNGALINLGGNISCFGKNATYEEFNIGITNPLKKDDIIELIKLNNQSVATSGNYERFVTIDGKRYAHVMDVRTGYPVENMLGVTVISKEAQLADILSTAVFINGVEYAEKIVEEYNDIIIHIFKLENGKMIYKLIRNNKDDS